MRCIDIRAKTNTKGCQKPALHFISHAKIGSKIAILFSATKAVSKQTFFFIWPIRNQNCSCWPNLFSDKEQNKNLHGGPNEYVSC